MSKPLEHKTIRPGSLSNYSFYYSSRNVPASPAVIKKNSHWKKMLLAVAVLGVAFFSFQQSANQTDSSQLASQTSDTQKIVTADSEKSKKTPAPAVAPVSSECAGNTLDKFIVISIDKRKLTACEGAKEAYSTPVITGDMRFPATETPKGTYKIFAKESDTVLRGSDEKGTWSFPVKHWMPFLENKYGTYGFHDANWKDQTEFGKIDPYTSDKASHGCIELNNEASAWLYLWAGIGTTLTVKA